MRYRWLHWLACFLAAATFILIVAGATVTSNRAGLAVTDWPSTYAQHLWRFPREKMVGNIFYEHGHRLIASGVGLLTTALALGLFFKPQRPWLRKLGIAALAIVLLQGLLGGLTVINLLPPPISIAHASLAQAFFCLTIAIAFLSSPRWLNWSHDTAAVTPEKSVNSKLAQGLALTTTIAVYIQLILGASIRHSERGVIAHMVGAGGVTVSVICLVVFVWRRLRQPEYVRPVVALATLVAIQIGLGLTTYFIRVPKDAIGQLSNWQIWLPTLHLTVGALILATSFALTLKLYWFLAVGERGRASFGTYVELTKPRIVTMVLVTTALGYFLGLHGAVQWPVFLMLLVGVGASTGGSAVLNNYLDRDVDTKMARTRERALPSGIISPGHALAYGVSLVLIGVLTLVWSVNLLTGFLTLLAAFLYVLVYTPMKRVSWLNTSFGAIPGAIPPLCGWAAVSGRLDVGAWVLFAILFVWQHPHFFSIAWMFKDDYRNAGLKMLPVVEPSGKSTFRQTILFSLLLIIVAVLPSFVGMTGQIYLYGSLVLSVGFLIVGIGFCRVQTFAEARKLLKASVIYLPLLVALMIFDKL